MLNIDTLTVASLKAEYAAKGYPLFTKPFDLNLFAVRASATRRAPDQWRCRLGVLWNNGLGESILLATGTTLPGVYWLKNPMKKAGTALIVPGFYKRAYQVGDYHGKPALRQIGPMDYYRDADKDEFAEEGTVVAEKGVNNTTHWHVGGGDTIGQDSAGCQNTDQTTIDMVIDLVARQEKAGHGNTLSYALFLEG